MNFLIPYVSLIVKISVAVSTKTSGYASASVPCTVGLVSALVASFSALTLLVRHGVLSADTMFVKQTKNDHTTGFPVVL